MDLAPVIRELEKQGFGQRLAVTGKLGSAEIAALGLFLRKDLAGKVSVRAKNAIIESLKAGGFGGEELVARGVIDEPVNTALAKLLIFGGFNTKPADAS